jgi:pSer/pThr/pTyr-binding forkhead associated (FHA) protein
MSQQPTKIPESAAVQLKALLEAERSGMAFVHWLDGDKQQHILTLTAEHQRVAVGRRVDQDVSISWDPEVSRTHAMLEYVGGDWTIVDDGLSRNGSFVNGSRIHGRQRLRHKDVMCFGDTRVTFKNPTDAETTDSTARASDHAADIPLSETQRKVLVALCRPLVDDSPTALPASNKQIADEVFLSVDAIKAHLRVLYDRYEIGDLPQMEKRARLASLVLDRGTLKPRDF